MMLQTLQPQRTSPIEASHMNGNMDLEPETADAVAAVAAASAASAANAAGAASSVVSSSVPANVSSNVPSGGPAGGPAGVSTTTSPPTSPATNGDIVANGNGTVETSPEHKITPSVEATPESSPVDTREPVIPETLKIAKKFYDEQFISVAPEEYIQLLAANDEESQQIRNHYMNLFKWPQDLLQSTRLLCSKLYLKGESQEIDRILSAFTKSYLVQHPNNIFATKNFEQIYIVIYSLILLNTSLHNSEISKKSRISQQDFIRDTFTTFIQQSKSKLSVKQRIVIERELSKYYDDLVKQELYLKTTPVSQAPVLQRRTSKREAASVPPAPPPPPPPPSLGQLQPETQPALIPIANEVETELSPQLSNSSGSIWSIDTNSIIRPNTRTSDVSSYSHQTQRNNDRVGLARALATDKENQQRKLLGLLPHSSFASTHTGRHSLRPRQSLDDLRQPLNKRMSHVSLTSRDSNNFHDELMSLLSFETVSLTGYDDDEDSLFNPRDKFIVDDYEDDYDLTLELQGSPYLKEGLLKLKITNNDQREEVISEQTPHKPPSISSKRSYSGIIKSFFKRNSHENTVIKHNPVIAPKFVENFVVVSKGELSLYSFDPKIVKKQKHQKNKHRPKIFEDEDDTIGDGNWLKNAAKVGNYNLCSTFAKLEPTISVSGKITHQWSLSFPPISKKPPMKFMFQSGTKEIALEFINACNFWAAKITAIPTLEESISSIEYGWTNLDYLVENADSFKKSKSIMKWEQVIPGIYLSKYIINDEDPNHLGMMKQFIKTLKYYNNLKKLYYEFFQKKHEFVTRLPKNKYNCSNYTRILNNFSSKINNYKSEINKYKGYVIMLGFGLQLRFDLEDQHASEREETPEEDDELTSVVKAEIKKLFLNMKDIPGVIPTFQQSKSISDIQQLQSQIPSPQMVKSPKTFRLAQLQNVENKSKLMKKTYSIINEVDEEDEEDLETKLVKDLQNIPSPVAPV